MPKKTQETESEFIPGAIQRIKLINFMTYKQFEIFPGPRMNVILGPNGAGKSTILCAICLGLGGKPVDVGRAGSVAEYIKHGCVTAKIEIELYKPGAGNHIVIREIQSNNQSAWKINAKNSSHKEVDELMSRLNIQVKNLCQFLPQDKVVEFVRMSTVELLENTEKAANISEMWQNHCRLKDWHKKTQTVEQNLAHVREDYERECKRNSYLDEQVAIYNAKQDHLDKIDILKKKRAWLIGKKENEKYLEAVKEERAQVKELNDLKCKLQPLTKLLRDKELESETVDSDFKELGTRLQQWKTKADDKLRQYEKFKENTGDAITAFKAKEREESDRINRLNVVHSQLKGLQNDLASVTHDDREINNELEVVSARTAELLAKYNDILDDKESASNNKRALERERNEINMELRQHKDIHQSKMQMLRQKDGEAHEVAVWVQQNRDKFKGSVHGPIMIDINMKNPAHAKYIERAIPFKDKVAFVCEEKSDMELLMTTARQQLRKRINAVMAPPQHYSVYKSPVPIDSIRHFGFHSYLIDMIEAPDAVLSYLCSQYRIHTIPVGDEQTRLRVNDIFMTTNFTSFYTENHQYSCKRSKYGNKAISTRSSPLSAANILTLNVNTAKIQELESKLEQREVVLKEIFERLDRLKNEDRQINEQMELLRNRKKELTKKRDRRKQLLIQIEQKEANILSLDSIKIDLEEEKQKRNAKLLRINEDKLKKIGEHEKICRDIIPLGVKRVGLAIDLRGLVQEKKKMEKDIQEKRGDLIVMERVVDTAKRNSAKLKERVKMLVTEARKICGLNGDDIPDSLHESFALLPDTVEELDTEIHKLQAKADCMTNTNADYVDEYKDSQRKLEILMRQKGDLELEMSQFGTDMNEIKNKWLPPLLALLSNVNKRFSHYLSTLGCAGEVGLNKGENESDYSKYGISIKVKYRDGDPLRELTQFFQSGGERSVATVLYLLSLQEFVRLPFCCVDEINQGMDSTNERRVFQLMTQILSSETRSQYFLVTPKLLPDMEFHDNVTIHFVTTGTINLKENLNVDIFIRRRADLDE